VVFPADREADAGPPRTERWIGRYLAFLATVAVGAVVVAIIAIVIGH
jgi:hypothetical protein